MPANSRWDLIRRLRVNRNTVETSGMEVARILDDGSTSAGIGC